MLIDNHNVMSLHNWICGRMMTSVMKVIWISLKVLSPEVFSSGPVHINGNLEEEWSHLEKVSLVQKIAVSLTKWLLNGWIKEYGESWIINTSRRDTRRLWWSKRSCVIMQDSKYKAVNVYWYATCLGGSTAHQTNIKAYERDRISSIRPRYTMLNK